MFDDGAVALTPPPRSSFEDELRALLDSLTPVPMVAPAVEAELAESSDRYGPGRPAPAEGGSAPDPPAPDPPAPDPPAPDPPAPDLPVPDVPAQAAAWDAQFAAGAAALAEARAAQTAMGAAQARRARALAAFARSRPLALDRTDAEVGAAAAASRAARPAPLAAVSEWAVDEVAVALGLTGTSAAVLLADSLRLVTALPATLAALGAGEITWAHARVMTDLVAPLRAEIRGQAEERLLARVAGKTPPQLREAARRVVARLDAEAITRRAAAAVRDRRVVLHPGDDGMGTLAAVLPLPVARAVHDALSRYADATAVPGDERTRAQRMADCLPDLVLRPGEHGMAPVQARLTVVAAVRTLLGGDEPGEVDGDVVPAAQVRALAAALGLLPPEGADEGTAGNTAGAAGNGAASPAGRGSLAGLLGTGRRTGTALAHRPHLALVDEVTGALLCLTDGPALRAAALAGQALGPPAPAPGYRPGTALDRHVRFRDRRCRFPGCRTRAATADLDHTTPWPSGGTSAANLHALCRHHHRLRHQAPGWQLDALPGGTLRWTTPTGQQVTTSPPRVGTDDDLPPPEGSSRAPAPADDPPPF